MELLRSTGLGAAALVLAACDAPPPPTVTPPELKPVDGRRMGIAKLAFEPCDAIYEEISRPSKWHPLSRPEDRFAARLGPPDGVRPHGERFWLAVDVKGDCYELVAGGALGGYGSHSSSACFPPAIGPEEPRDSGAR